MCRHSVFEEQINRDLSRTFPEEEFFKDKDGDGQAALASLMKVSVDAVHHSNRHQLHR